jgi:hypothetical protein
LLSLITWYASVGSRGEVVVTSSRHRGGVEREEENDGVHEIGFVVVLTKPPIPFPPRVVMVLLMLLLMMMLPLACLNLKVVYSTTEKKTAMLKASRCCPRNEPGVPVR